jgi:DNA adenine methylase
MGSKARIAKEILPIMLEYRDEGMTWVEPMVGGGNMIDKVDGKRIGADINKYLIEALILISDGSRLPKNNSEFTETDYIECCNHLRNGSKTRFSEGMIGYAMFSFSFGAKWLGGWSRGKPQKDIKEITSRSNTEQTQNNHNS